MNDLQTKPLELMSTKEIAAITAAMPDESRAAWGRVLDTAAKCLKAMGRDYPKAFELARSVVHNAWHLGEVLEEAVSQGSGPRKRNPQGDNILTLADLGVNPNQSSRCQKLRKRYGTETELDVWVDSVRDEEKYTLPSLRPASEAAHVSSNTGEPEWYTPVEYIEAARAVMGGIDLDPASSEIAQATVKAESFYTIEDNGLEQEWTGRVWMNPPYTSGVVSQFTVKLSEHYKAGDVTTACALVNNATDSGWFQALAEDAAAICFPKGRIRFLDDEGNPGAPLQGQAVLYFGGAKARFRKEFSGFGLVLESKK